MRALDQSCWRQFWPDARVEQWTQFDASRNVALAVHPRHYSNKNPDDPLDLWIISDWQVDSV